MPRERWIGNPCDVFYLRELDSPSSPEGSDGDTQRASQRHRGLTENSFFSTNGVNGWEGPIEETNETLGHEDAA
jgi:hypothetical protein